MADNKKYYYMRLKENFFDDDTMILLESMKDGYIYSNILLKLYLRSLKDEGRLMLNGRIPYSPTMLASVTRHSVGDVEKALKIFLELGIIEILDDGAIYMLDIQNFIGKGSTEADRRREYDRRIREEKLTAIECEKSCEKSHEKTHEKSTPEIEIEIDIEKSKNNKPKKSKYGEYENVLLTDEELDKLKERYPRDWQERIERLSEYIASQGRKYKSHYATINAWARKDGVIPAKNTVVVEEVIEEDLDSLEAMWNAWCDK